MHAVIQLCHGYITESLQDLPRGGVEAGVPDAAAFQAQLLRGALVAADGHHPVGVDGRAEFPGDLQQHQELRQRGVGLPVQLRRPDRRQAPPATHQNYRRGAVPGLIVHRTGWRNHKHIGAPRQKKASDGIKGTHDMHSRHGAAHIVMSSRAAASSKTFLTLETRSYQLESTTIASSGSCESSSSVGLNSLLRKSNISCAAATSA